MICHTCINSGWRWVSDVCGCWCRSRHREQNIGRWQSIGRFIVGMEFVPIYLVLQWKWYRLCSRFDKYYFESIHWESKMCVIPLFLHSMYWSYLNDTKPMFHVSSLILNLCNRMYVWRNICFDQIWRTYVLNSMNFSKPMSFQNWSMIREKSRESKSLTSTNWSFFKKWNSCSKCFFWISNRSGWTGKYVSICMYQFRTNNIHLIDCRI